MLRMYCALFSVFAMLVAGSLSVFCQSTMPVRGKVQLKKEDGSMAPVSGATVQVYRTDIKQGGPAAKTNNKGEFNFAGLQLGATYALAVSGPGIKAELVPGIRAGNEAVEVTVMQGDGKALTENEVRSALSTAPKASSGQSSQADAEEAKKAKEEYERQVAEVTAKNKKIEDTNKIINEALTAGNNAYGDKNYDLAISKFQMGIDADPDFAGSGTVLNNNKAVALRMRAFEYYKKGNADPANRASWLEKARDDFAASIAASKRTLELIAKLGDAPEAAKYSKEKVSAIANLVEANRLMVHTGADASEAAANAAIEALNQYLAVETDSAQRIKNQIYVATAIRTKVGSALAIPIYKAVLEVDPNNIDAMGNLGLCMFDAGVTSNNKEQMQEGLNLMQKFADTAPDKPGDREYAEFKQSVKDAVTYLKDQEKLTPQKIKTTTPAKKKP